jgi:indolepyruvate decarboxylase
MPTNTTVSSYIITRLKQAGIEHVFAVPGDYASPFLITLDSTPGITRIPNINELGVGYAADGYARFKGAGAACVQYGVGSFSMLNCAAGSWVERVPVAVISASPATKDRMLERTEEILFHHSTGDFQTDRLVFDNVTVASEIIHDPVTAPAQIDHAITAMLTYKRPIYIEVLHDVLSMNCESPKGKLEPVTIPSKKDSLNAAVDAAFERIAAAKMPVIWAGVEIQRFGLQDSLKKLIAASGLFWTTTSLGKTILDETGAQFIGTYADAASPAITRAIMLATDCILTLGAIVTDDYLPIMASSFGKMIEVNDEEARIGYQYYYDVMMGDFINALTAKLKKDKRFPRKYKLPKVAPDPLPVINPADKLTYNIFYHELTNFLNKEKMLRNSALILGESTSLYVFGNLFGMPANSFVANAAWGSLGHETGCALGVALASGKRPIVVAGDGGFRMVAQELSSLAYQKCNAIVFVMSNNAYAIEQAFVDLSAFTPKGSYAPFDILPEWDYCALAQAFGAAGFRAETVEELRAILPEIKKIKDRPALVEIKIPQKDLAPQLARLAAVPPPKSKYRKVP